RRRSPIKSGASSIFSRCSFPRSTGASPQLCWPPSRWLRSFISRFHICGIAAPPIRWAISAPALISQRPPAKLRRCRRRIIDWLRRRKLCRQRQGDVRPPHEPRRWRKFEMIETTRIMCRGAHRAAPLPVPLPTPASWGEGEEVELRMVHGFNARIVRSGNSHPGPMASQARHESVSPKETNASRYVVPREGERGGHVLYLCKSWLQPQFPVHPDENRHRAFPQMPYFGFSITNISTGRRSLLIAIIGRYVY
ncbi:MAG: hypothetical protein JWQ04_2045, partial [Pedosphaera sp.]|nr:hypothetical protein [Pedosphaera sp.]